MGNSVFANGREVACKAGSGKSICAFPDVCMTPPENPATPPGVPVPYPNTGMDSDTTSGSTTVQISGKEVMLKDKSYFKKSSGDEAGSAAKKGVVSSVNRGKVYFTAWSMDVKFEGENVVRHLDMTTHNHGSPSNTATWIFASNAAMGKGGVCEDEAKQEKAACKGIADPCGDAGLTTSAGDLTKKQSRDLARQIQTGGAGKARKDMTAKQKALECVKARRCQLGPYKPSQCCPSQTPDHVLPKASFYVTNTEGNRLPGWGGENGYDPDKAPCMCAEGPNNSWGSHGLRHRHHRNVRPKVGGKFVAKGERMPFKAAISHAANSSVAVFGASGCSKECIEHQLERGHKDMHEGASPPEVKYAPSGGKETEGQISTQIKAMGGGP